MPSKLTITFLGCPPPDDEPDWEAATAWLTNLNLAELRSAFDCCGMPGPYGEGEAEEAELRNCAQRSLEAVRAIYLHVESEAGDFWDYGDRVLMGDHEVLYGGGDPEDEEADEVARLITFFEESGAAEKAGFCSCS